MKRSKKKRPATAKNGVAGKRKESTVASDEALREELRNFDLGKFDKALEKAINPKQTR